MREWRSFACPQLFLFGVLVAYVFLWVLYPHSFNASDPFIYSRNAYDFSCGNGFGRGDIFGQRLGVILPVAAMYATFGVNILTTNAWPLCAALLIIITVWAALPDVKSKMTGAVLCLTSVPLFDGAVALYPDIIATAFMALSSLVLFSRRRLLDRRGIWALIPAAGVLLLFFAFLAKESAYWVLPIWVIAFAVDIRSAERTRLFRRFYIPAFMAGVLLGIAYLAFCGTVWGDPFIRFANIEAYTGKHLWSWDKAPVRDLVMRLTVFPFALFATQYDVICISTVLSLFVIPRRLANWALYTFSCVVFFWFGSTSFSSYEPMPLSQRMTLPALPGLYILSAYFLSRLEIPSPRAVIRHVLPVLVIVAVVGLPFARFVSSWNDTPDARGHAAGIVRTAVGLHPERQYALVCSDARSPRSLAFYFGYEYPSNLQVVFAGDVAKTVLFGRERYVLVDADQSAFLRLSYGAENFDARIHSLAMTEVYRSGGIALYRDNRGLLDGFSRSGDCADWTGDETKQSYPASVR